MLDHMLTEMTHPFLHFINYWYCSLLVCVVLFTSHEENLRRMNTSVKLNELIVEKSHDASLVIVNLPAPPKQQGQEENCIFYL